MIIRLIVLDQKYVAALYSLIYLTVSGTSMILSLFYLHTTSLEHNHEVVRDFGVIVAPEFVILIDALKRKIVVLILNYMRCVIIPLMKAIPRVTYFRTVVLHGAAPGLQRFEVGCLQTLRPAFHHELNFADLSANWLGI